MYIYIFHFHACIMYNNLTGTYVSCQNVMFASCLAAPRIAANSQACGLRTLKTLLRSVSIFNKIIAESDSLHTFLYCCNPCKVCQWSMHLCMASSYNQMLFVLIVPLFLIYVHLFQIRICLPMSNVGPSMIKFLLPVFRYVHTFMYIVYS